MAYHKYSTEGIILKHLPLGEANLAAYILTADFGLIIAYVQAVRLQKSKLRGALIEWSMGSISLVKGKNGWKITDVISKQNFFFELPHHKTLARISSVLLKMIPGEAPSPDIFKIVISGLEFLKTLGEKDVSSFEALIILRILKELGYVASNSEVEQFFGNQWDLEILQKISAKKSLSVRLINKGLKESQL